MHLGGFSLSLAVKDIQASKEFYEKLGFTAFHGSCDDNWMILKNGDTTIGLFQGMFENNIMTFNPGWDTSAQELDEFTDIREIQKHYKEQGLTLEKEADESSSGPAHLVLTDPDGNTIMLDQHR